MFFLGTGTTKLSTYLPAMLMVLPFVSERWESSGEEPLELIERAGPAEFVAVAGFLVEELLVNERQRGAVAVGPQRHGDKRFAFRGRALGPGEDEPLVRHALAVDAADVMLLAVFGVEDDAEAPADAQIGLG